MGTRKAKAFRLADVVAAIEIEDHPSALGAWISRGYAPLEDSSRYRSYSLADIARLAIMRLLVAYGMPPAQAGGMAARVLPIAAGYAPDKQRHQIKWPTGNLIVWRDGDKWRMRIDHCPIQLPAQVGVAIVIDMPAIVHRAIDRVMCRL